MATEEELERLRAMRALAVPALERAEPNGLWGSDGEGGPAKRVFQMPSGSLPSIETGEFLIALWPHLDDLLGGVAHEVERIPDAAAESPDDPDSE